MVHSPEDNGCPRFLPVYVIINFHDNNRFVHVCQWKAVGASNKKGLCDEGEARIAQVRCSTVSEEGWGTDEIINLSQYQFQHASRAACAMRHRLDGGGTVPVLAKGGVE